MSKYDISTFTRYDLGPLPPEMVLNISDSGGFSFNAELQKKLPVHFCIYASPDKRVLCIEEAADTSFTLPKNGRTKGPVLLQDIKSAGVILPAKYIFSVGDGKLIGELKLPDTPKSDAGKQKPIRHKSRRISKSEEEHPLEELDSGGLC